LQSAKEEDPIKALLPAQAGDRTPRHIVIAVSPNHKLLTITDRDNEVEMTLSKKQRAGLESIIKQAKLILRGASASETRSAGARKANSSNTKGKKAAGAARKARRTAADAAALRKEILAARKKGARVAELAEKHGVTQSYIYQMR
jgi:hypothetical protein